MGWGDELIATGLARGASARKKLIAFGDGKRIIWSDQSYALFAGNPNVVRPGEEGRYPNMQWINYYRGHRIYGTCMGGRWTFKPFKCPPGEVFFSDSEMTYADIVTRNDGDHRRLILLEPRVKKLGACSGENKQWPVEYYQELARRIHRETNYACVQFVPPNATPLLQDVRPIKTRSFRDALAALERCILYVGPEGGLHHGAAATSTPAVVIFGGFNSPQSTGYDFHHNIAVGPPCGHVSACSHCRDTMRSITVDRVFQAAIEMSSKPLPRLGGLHTTQVGRQTGVERAAVR